MTKTKPFDGVKDESVFGQTSSEAQEAEAPETPVQKKTVKRIPQNVEEKKGRGKPNVIPVDFDKANIVCRKQTYMDFRHASNSNHISHNLLIEELFANMVIVDGVATSTVNIPEAIEKYRNIIDAEKE